MSIKLNKEFIKDVKKEIRNKNNRCGMYITIDIENKEIKFSFDRYNTSKYSEDRYSDIILKDKIEVESGYNFKRVYMSNIDFNDVLLDVLLSEDIYIEPYKKNIDNLINDNGTKCYLSTIIIRNNKKYAKYYELCTEHFDCIIV